MEANGCLKHIGQLHYSLGLILHTSIYSPAIAIYCTVRPHHIGETVQTGFTGRLQLLVFRLELIFVAAVVTKTWISRCIPSLLLLLSVIIHLSLLPASPVQLGFLCVKAHQASLNESPSCSLNKNFKNNKRALKVTGF